VAHEHTRPDEFEGPPMISVQLALRSHGTAVHASISTHVVPLFTRPLGHTHVSPSPVIEVSARADVCVCVCVRARVCVCVRSCIRSFSLCNDNEGIVTLTNKRGDALTPPSIRRITRGRGWKVRALRMTR
jgi:hypothetical protein